MKRIYLLFTLLAFFLNMQAQVTDAEKTIRAKPSVDTVNGWKTGGIFNLGISQTSLTHWAAGGESSFAGNGLISLFANWKKGKNTWENNFNIGYGFMKRGSDKSAIKTDDKIELNSKYGREIVKNLYYAGFASFKTQMAPGYNYPNDSVRISDFLAPAYILVALGLDYKPADNLSFFVAPLTGRIIIVNSQRLADTGAFGVDKGDKHKEEFGGYIRMNYKIDLMQNVTLQTMADFFSNYLENPLNIVVNWEVLLSMKVNKYIAATIGTTLIYDDAIKIKDPTSSDPNHAGPRVQFKEVLSIGVSYKF
jgi:hypothetical protein